MKPSKNTNAKIGILNLIKQSKVALSQAEIRSSLDGLCDRVTFYRVLERLISEHLIHRIVTPEGETKYAYCKSKDHHLHFSCKRCKSVICLQDTVPKFDLPLHYELSEMSFIVSGICPQCAS